MYLLHFGSIGLFVVFFDWDIGVGMRKGGFSLYMVLFEAYILRMERSWSDVFVDRQVIWEHLNRQCTPMYGIRE